MSADLPLPLAASSLADLGPQAAVLAPTLPLFWDGKYLWRSRGIISANNTPNGGIFPYNEIPAATAMCYYQGHLWYAQGRTYSAGDTVYNQSSGSVNYNYADSVLRVTENPLATGGDGFTVPTQAGNITAIGFAANLNTTLGQGALYMFTNKQIYTLAVPVNRSAWISATANNQPLQTLAQEKWGATSDRCLVAVNGDIFYQSLEPAIRSLVISLRYFSQWGNVPISRNMNRVLEFNDRGKMQFATGCLFQNRLYQGLLPVATPVGVAFQAVAALDFDIVSVFQNQITGNVLPPAWEGILEGLDILQLFSDTFGGLERCFAMVHSRVDDSIALWELTDYLTSDMNLTGQARVSWGMEFPAFTWGHEFDLKQLDGGEMWLDSMQGPVDMTFYYREDSNPCWTQWFQQSFCSAQNSCATVADPVCYPVPPDYCQGYRFPITFPKPQPNQCSPAQKRQSTRGYQFQVKVAIKGWCRVRGLILFAIPVDRAPFEGLNS